MASPVITEWFRHVPEDKYQRDPVQSKADAAAIWQHLKLAQGVRVFECPCAKADIGYPLARLGATVEGIDFNSHFVTAAKNKFYRAALPGTFKTGDMRTAVFPTDVDVIVNWSSSFGYFSDEANLALLKKFHDALKAGGTLLLEVGNPDRVVTGLSTRLLATGETAEEQWDPATHRASILFPANSFRGPVMASIRIYSRQEYENLLPRAGFTQVQFFGPGFTAYDSVKSERLIVQATKA